MHRTSTQQSVRCVLLSSTHRQINLANPQKFFRPHVLKNGCPYSAFGPKANHRPIVADAAKIPRLIAVQKPNPSRVVNASGTKKGRPSGTRIRVSLASFEMLARSWFRCHVMTKARMLTIGRVNNNAPNRGDRFDTSATKPTIRPATTARTRNAITYSNRAGGDVPAYSKMNLRPDARLISRNDQWQRHFNL